MSRIGELLLELGIVTEEQLNEALQLQETGNKRLGEILIELGYVSSDDLHWMLSEQANMPFVEIEPTMLDAALIVRFPKKLLYEHTILPLHESETRIYVAVGDPTDATAIERMERAASKIVIASGAAPAKIKQLLDDFYTDPLKKKQLVTCVRMTANNAEIEFIEAGRTRKRKCSSAEIEIRIGKDKGEPQNE